MRETPIVDADFFRAPITVVVEDQMTRTFLTELWQDPKIGLRVGAGRAGVEAIARGASSVAQRVVVGLTDLDFFTPSPEHWSDRSKSVIRLGRHEIENYLLDWVVLAKIAHREPHELEAAAASRARGLVWWMACKRVLHLCSRDLTDEFIAAPRVPPDSQAADAPSAIGYLQNHPFWSRHRSNLQRWQAIDLQNKVTEEGQRYEQECASGRWLESFSGKEILQQLRSSFPLDHVDASRVTPAQRAEDLARGVAREMRKASRVPPDLERLRAALHQRAGLKA